MIDYQFQLVDAAFIASSLAVQAKGATYRLRFNKDRDVVRQTNYQLDALSGLTMPQKGAREMNIINAKETPWAETSDYWLGRTTLTDLAICIPGEGYLYINDITMNVSLQKEILCTALVGHKGTIKEYITDGDYQISMSVGIVSVNSNGEIIDQYPERAIAQLHDIMRLKSNLEVSSAFLDLFGISKIVIVGFSAKQMTHGNRQVIEITALSDIDYEIESNSY